MYASQSGHTECLSLLLSHNANTDFQTTVKKLYIILSIYINNKYTKIDIINKLLLFSTFYNPQYTVIYRKQKTSLFLYKN